MTSGETPTNDPLHSTSFLSLQFSFAPKASNDFPRDPSADTPSPGPQRPPTDPYFGRYSTLPSFSLKSHLIDQFLLDSLFSHVNNPRIIDQPIHKAAASVNRPKTPQTPKRLDFEAIRNQIKKQYLQFVENETQTNDSQLSADRASTKRLQRPANSPKASVRVYKTESGVARAGFRNRSLKRADTTDSDGPTGDNSTSMAKFERSRTTARLLESSEFIGGFSRANCFGNCL